MKAHIKVDINQYRKGINKLFNVLYNCYCRHQELTLTPWTFEEWLDAYAQLVDEASKEQYREGKQADKKKISKKNPLFS